MSLEPIVSNERAVLSAFTDLVQLVNHPGDIVTWRHFAMTPLAGVKYPDGVPEANEISLEFAKLFANNGISKTFKELRSLVVNSMPEQWSKELDMAFEEMIKEDFT